MSGWHVESYMTFSHILKQHLLSFIKIGFAIRVDYKKEINKENKKINTNKASQAIQSPRTVPFFLLVSLLDRYSFPNVLVKGIVAFKH